MSIKAQPSFALKDKLFNAATLRVLADGLRQAHPRFKQRSFEREVLARFSQLELKERINWIVAMLESYLPTDFIQAQDILQRALPEPLDPSKTDDDFGRFIWVVPGEYVAKHGCTENHLLASLDFLREATKRCSSENAIRPFLDRFPEQTMAFVRDCASDSHYHVRRLASEGIRPFLPWSQRVKLPPAQIIGVLSQLYTDETRFVTRSVANTLNDLSKIDPEMVIDTLKRWQQQKGQHPAELRWMTRHALRTLLKQSHPATLELLGYPTTPRFRVSLVSTTEDVKVGDAFVWRCTLTSLAVQKLKIALRIHFLKANGRHSTKVFTVKDAQLAKGERLHIDKRQVFKPITTRVLYPGIHFAELVVNGIASEKRKFELVQ